MKEHRIKKVELLKENHVRERGIQPMKENHIKRKKAQRLKIIVPMYGRLLVLCQVQPVKM